MLNFLTREVWDTLIYATIIVGGALALWRLWQDLARARPKEKDDDERQEGEGPRARPRP
jgi:hypothetical protein